MTTNTGKLRELEGRQSQLLRLVELSVILNSTLDLNELLQTITVTATELLDCEASSILLYDEKHPRLYFAAATGSDPAELAKIPVPIEGSLAGTIFRTNQPMILNNVEQDPRHYTMVSDKVKFKTQTLLGVPMPIKDRTMGVLEAINNARLLQETRDALKHVRDANEVKNNFLALASHELRTPLGIIMGYSQFLKEDTKDEAQELASHVLKAARQMRTLLDEMSNLTMLKADTMDLHPQKVPLQDVLAFASEGIKELALAHEQNLIFKFPDEPIHVNVDVDKTSLAFINLLNNATRFSSNGTDMTIGVGMENEQALAWVQDQGIGIPSDKLEKIFEEFYQIEPPNTRHYGGLGIGLPIAKGIIEAQSGKIWAESEGLDKGATFKVSLPKAD